ncbi:hypothetical protein [Paeniglutamicibacter sp.]|uniref:hypothetical protein n=1 Tax=Paeniglutamicibacter sp. TaxID=1934391 RepID=UPI0039899F8E
MDFDESVADQLMSASDEAVAVLSEQRGPRASVTGEALDEFRGPFAVMFQRNAAAQSAARNGLVSALEELVDQVRFAKARAEEAGRELKAEQDNARWHLIHGETLVPGVANIWTRVLGLALSHWFSESEVRRPEVALPPLIFEPHVWATSGGSGTSSAVPDALRQAASLVFDQKDAAERVCQRVVSALGRFQASCSWALSDVGTFTPAVSQFNKDDLVDAGKLWRIAEAFGTAGQDTDLAVPVELSTTALTLAVSPSEVPGETLLTFLATASPLEVEVASGNREWVKPLASVPLERIAKWWAGLKGNGPDIGGGLDAANGYSAQQAMLLGAAPTVFRNLDGMPASARVYANQLAVPTDIEAAEKELTALQEHSRFSRADPKGDDNRMEFLTSEIAYLKAVQSGNVQLYLYDRRRSRIVEMIGTPGEDTRRVVTYVPGTFTSLKSFYDGGTQEFSRYLVGEARGTVAFVYKDGLFPGENQREGGLNLRLGEANDPERGLNAGRQLAGFQPGMQSDPLLRGTEQVGIGHSWGYQNLTSSEIFGAEYEKSISLSGAGIHEQWVPDAGTLYSNFVYEDDALRWAQLTGQVWDGKVPSAEEGFANHFYARPDGEVHPIDSHSLIATNSQENDEVLKHVLNEVMK